MVNPIVQLRKRLKKEGLTQVALADKIGVSETLISLVLSGARPPNDGLLDYLQMDKETRVIYRWRNGHEPA
jgi:transcriptional regulator with XRE-family HTH domain